MTAPALRPACLFAALFACTAATAADGLRIHPTPPTAFDRIDRRWIEHHRKAQAEPEGGAEGQ